MLACTRNAGSLWIINGTVLRTTSVYSTIHPFVITMNNSLVMH